MSVFKACDIRGVAGRELTPALYARIGRGIAAMMGERRTIVVGGDVRLSTPELTAGLMQGLSERGREVINLGIVPTPVVYFARRRLAVDACAMVTASHNPPEYNGLKFVIGDLPVLPEDLDSLRELVEGAETDAAAPERAAAVASRDVLADYETSVRAAAGGLLSADVPGRGPLTVVLDAGNGAYAEIGPRVMARVPGISVDPLFCVTDGRFPERDPNCAVAANLAALSARVREIGADVGVAFDGDGDRVAFVDETGGMISGDETIVLLMRFLGDRMRGERVVHDLKCSRIVAREAERLGATPLMERSGHAFIKRRMIREGALFGGEASGHYFHRALHGGDDGLFTALLGVGFVLAAGRSLGELRRDVPRRFITEDIRVPWPRENTGDLMARLRGAFPAERINELDGVRVSFPRGWGLLRASITEPKITLRFEGEDAESLREVIEAFVGALPELKGEVERAVGLNDE